tara:strand:- start:111 stop:1238 length:1128 start_codon:yes stop_codon:yes gene_type:complete
MSNFSNNIILNSKIRFVQRNFRLKKISSLFNEFRKLKLNQSAKNMEFNNFSKLIRTKDVILKIRDIAEYYNSIGFKNKLNGQKLLTSYILKFFAKDILGQEEKWHQDDRSIIQWGENLIDIFENLKVDDYRSFKTLGDFLVSYEEAMLLWLKNDKNRTIEHIIISYYNRMEHIQVIVKNTKLNSVQKKNMLNELKNNLKELMISMKLLDKSFDIEYFQKNYINIYQNMEKGYKNILNSLTLNMKKAFTMKLLEDIKNGEIKSILSNFMEIGERIILICPKKYKDSFKKKFNEEHMIECLVSNIWNKELIDHINFITDSIIMFDSKFKEKENFEFKKNLNILTLNDYENNIVNIILLLNEKIDELVKSILELSKKN